MHKEPRRVPPISLVDDEPDAVVVALDDLVDAPDQLALGSDVLDLADLERRAAPTEKPAGRLVIRTDDDKGLRRE